MPARRMETFSFDGNSLEEIHGWMQQGRGLDGIQPAIEALSGLSRDLENSMDALRTALTAIGAWAGPAGDGAEGATRQGEEWVVVTMPQVTDSAQSADGVASGFVSTRSRMPSPAEAELTDGERSMVSWVPIAGPILDQQAADAKRDRVTTEARQRMLDWQDAAQGSVDAVQPLPTVPRPVVDVAAPQQTGPAGVQHLPTVPAQPAGPPAAGQPAAPPAPAPSQPIGPVPGARPVPPVPPAPAPSQPIGPTATPAPGRPPLAGLSLFPFPVGGGGGDTAGRRRAYGPGAFNADEIARSRGTGRGGVIGAPAGKGPMPDAGEAAGRGAAGRGAVPDADEHAARRGPAGTAGAPGAPGAAHRGAAGGPIMQPAVGATRGEGDGEHSDKYAVQSDEYFVGDPQRVAPPVIGG